MMYPLPEAQVDRFMLKLHVGYPSRDEEKLVLRRMAGGIPIVDFNMIFFGRCTTSNAAAFPIRTKIDVGVVV